jgi:hypothetical protein
MSQSYFHSDENHLMDFAMSKGRNLKGKAEILQVKPDATNTPAFGSIVTYKIRRNGDQFLNKGHLVTVISPVTKTGGTYARLSNAGGIFMWKRFEIWQFGELKRTVQADFVFNNLLYNTNNDHFSFISQAIGYDVSTSNRNTAAGGAQTFAINLQRLFNLFAKPLDRTLINDDLEIRGYLQDSVVNVCQTDGTSPTFTITDTYLDLEYVDPKSKIINATRQLYIDNGKMGEPMFDVEYIQNITTLVSGATTATINLPELKDRDVIDLQVIIRPSASLNAVNADYTDTYTAATSWNLKSNSLYLNGVQSDITSTYYQRVVLPRLKVAGENNLISGTGLRNDFIISFAQNYSNETSDFKQYSGSRLFKESDVKLGVNFASLGANNDLYVNIRCAKRAVISNGNFKDLH